MASTLPFCFSASRCRVLRHTHAANRRSNTAAPTPAPIPTLAPTDRPEDPSLVLLSSSAGAGDDDDCVGCGVSRSLDWKLSWNIGARAMTVRVKVVVVLDSSSVMVEVTTSGRIWVPMSTMSVPEH